MTLNLSPQIEAGLYDIAQQEGIDPVALIEKMFREYEAAHHREVRGKKREAIALLRSWRAEDATEDAEELDRRDRETSELMRNLVGMR